MGAEHKFDWAELRQTALDCLDAVWSLICWAESSQDDDYSAESAALHMAAIDRARETFVRASIILLPGCFDSLVTATVGEGPRPDFRFGPVCCATAHESALELLRWAGLRLENCCFDDAYGGRVVGIDGLQEVSVQSVLHAISPAALRDTLRRWGKRTRFDDLLDGQELRQLTAWIHREWAAVSQSQRDSDEDGGEADGGPLPPDSFRWDSRIYSPIPRGPFLALTAAWQCEGRCIHKDDLAEALGDHADTVGDYAMHGIRGELNKFFRKNGIPLHATAKNRSLAIKDGTPPQARAKKRPTAKRSKRRKSD